MNSAEDVLQRGRQGALQVGGLQSGKIESLRIRARVTEPYVTSWLLPHLGRCRPEPRVYWHPRFLDRLGKVLGVSQ